MKEKTKLLIQLQQKQVDYVRTDLNKVRGAINKTYIEHLDMVRDEEVENDTITNTEKGLNFSMIYFMNTTAARIPETAQENSSKESSKPRKRTKDTSKPSKNTK